MAGEDDDRDHETNHLVQNNANISGNGNKMNQAGGHIVEGNYTEAADEGRVKTDIFSLFSEISQSVGRFLFKVGLGDKLERLFGPAFTVLLSAVLVYYGTVAHTAFELTGTPGRIAWTTAYVYELVSGLLAEVLAIHWAIGVALAAIILLPVGYKVTKLGTTCERCQRPFAVVTRTIEYPSQTTFDNEGRKHTPIDREQYCIYCDGDVEADDSTDDERGEGATPVMTDGGDDGSGACCCSCHSKGGEDRED